MEYLYTVLILVGIYTILASSFNLIIGFGGLISIAHPIFFALAAYCSAILNLRMGVPIPLAIVAGPLFPTAAAGVLALRRPPPARRPSPGAWACRSRWRSSPARCSRPRCR